MKRKIIKTSDGKYRAIEQRVEQSALEYIRKRLEYSVPIDTINVVDMKRAINNMNVKIDRAPTLEELNAIVGVIKNYLINMIDQMPKYEIKLNERRCDHGLQGNHKGKNENEEHVLHTFGEQNGRISSGGMGIIERTSEQRHK